MPAWGHYDETATKEARRNGTFKDRRSRVLVRLDGSLLIRLKGRDMSELHDRVFERDMQDGIFHCWDATFSWQENTCAGPLELSHDIPRGKGGSDTMENTHCRCRRHHKLRDNREVRLRSQVSV